MTGDFISNGNSPRRGPLTTRGIQGGPGGVMTAEAGVITGSLTLRTRWDGRLALLEIQYDDATEWYVVRGSPLSACDEESVTRTHRPWSRLCKEAEEPASPTSPRKARPILRTPRPLLRDGHRRP